MNISSPGFQNTSKKVKANNNYRETSTIMAIKVASLD
jgi:hypothetical protein